MTTIKAYISSLTQIQEISTDRFSITLQVGITDSSQSQLVVTFEADWGADWKLLAREAIGEAFFNALGETVSGIIYHDLSTTI